MRSFGTNEYGDKNSFTIKCNKCGKEAYAIPTHHYTKNALLMITFDFSCSCGNKYGATIHDTIPFNDELIYKLYLEDTSTVYVKLWFSSNPPADKNNPGCIGISILDNDLKEINGGELDYTDPNVELKDMLSDCIEFLDIKVDQKYFNPMPLRILSDGKIYDSDKGIIIGENL